MKTHKEAPRDLKKQQTDFMNMNIVVTKTLLHESLVFFGILMEINIFFLFV